MGYFENLTVRGGHEDRWRLLLQSYEAIGQKMRRENPVELEDTAYYPDLLAELWEKAGDPGRAADIRAEKLEGQRRWEAHGE
jgi:hypothetical protein